MKSTLFPNAKYRFRVDVISSGGILMEMVNVEFGSLADALEAFQLLFATVPV